MRCWRSTPVMPSTSIPRSHIAIGAEGRSAVLRSSWSLLDRCGSRGRVLVGRRSCPSYLEVMVKGFERVLLFGASGGIGSALDTALSGLDVTTLSRSRDGFDLTDEASIAAAAKRTSGPFDLIFD